MNRFKKIILVAIVLALVGGVVGWRWNARNSRKLPFRVASVNRGDLVATISATGTLEPVEVVDVGAQVAGLILTFGTDLNGKTIDYGSITEEGAVVAKIEDSGFAPELGVAHAQMERAKAGE